VFVVFLGLIQLCCLSAAAEFRAGESRLLLIAGWICSISGAIVAVPASTLFRRGVGGRKGGTRYENFEGRIAGGSAAKPHLLPRVILFGGIGGGLVCLANLTTLLAVMVSRSDAGPFLVVWALLAISTAGTAGWMAYQYRRHAETLRRLPRPVPPPPGALPAAGSLESIALRFGRGTHTVCMYAAVSALVGCLFILATAIFTPAPVAFAALPLPAFAGYACYRARQEIETGLRTRDHRARVGLLWGLAGGFAGSIPFSITLILTLGLNLGWWNFGPESIPEVIQAALGQPMGFCFTPFVFPLGLCGVTLGAFGRELSTPRSADDRIAAEQAQGAP